MRIISGQYRGRKLKLPANIKSRPTTDMAKEGLFNILGGMTDFPGLKVLDLFSGTGAISLEFLSRGAHSVTAIDVDIVSKHFLDAVVRDWKIDNLKVVKADVFKLLRNPSGQFDLVFCDPPYADPRFPELPNMILDSGWVKPGGILILEHSPDHKYKDHSSFVQHRSYGGVNFTFFEN